MPLLAQATSHFSSDMEKMRNQMEALSELYTEALAEIEDLEAALEEEAKARENKEEEVEQLQRRVEQHERQNEAKHEPHPPTEGEGGLPPDVM